jgi:hypothetical protein
MIFVLAYQNIKKIVISKISESLNVTIIQTHFLSNPSSFLFLGRESVVT